MRPLEHLSKRARAATPLPFARYLVGRVREMFGVQTVAVLWVQRTSVYWRLFLGVELWGLGRDARKYAGPHPVVCHPPCGPWGNYKSKSHESKEHGVKAMELVHRWGGVIEHPVGSSLFRDHGRPEAVVEKVNQGDFGHQARKATLLYWWKS